MKENSNASTYYLELPKPDDEFMLPHSYVRIYGHGHPLLLLHGNRGSAYSFAYLIPQLREQYMLIIPDLPGHGKGPNMKPEFVTERELAVAYCFEIIDFLGIQTISICGHSLGGMIAELMYLEQPKRIRALVLLDSFVDIFERPSNLNRLDAFPGSSDKLKCEVADAFNDGPGVLWHRQFDITSEIKRFACPVLELQGEANEGTDEAFAQWLLTKRNQFPTTWKVIRIPKSGHFIQVEQPKLVSTLILDFFDKIIKK